MRQPVPANVRQRLQRVRRELFRRQRSRHSAPGVLELAEVVDLVHDAAPVSPPRPSRGSSRHTSGFPLDGALDPMDPAMDPMDPAMDSLDVMSDAFPLGPGDAEMLMSAWSSPPPPPPGHQAMPDIPSVTLTTQMGVPASKCAICLCAYKVGDSVCWIPCQRDNHARDHLFHRDCIRQWAATCAPGPRTCPECRGTW